MGDDKEVCVRDGEGSKEEIQTVRKQMTLLGLPQ